MNIINKFKSSDNKKDDFDDSEDHRTDYAKGVIAKYNSNDDDNDSSDKQKSSWFSKIKSERQHKRKSGWKKSNNDLWNDDEHDTDDPKLDAYYKAKKERAKQKEANENSIFSQMSKAFSEF